MYFDALTLAAIADELRTNILGGRIQRVVLTGPLAIGLEIYTRGQRHQLLASAHNQFARVHFVQQKLSRGVEQTTPLLLLMRKYLLGGRVVAVEQPELERMLVLSIVKEVEARNRTSVPDSDADADALPLDGLEAEPTAPGHIRDLLHCDLVIEPMDRRSNIVLVDDNNLILESVKRVTAKMSRRVILPRQVFEIPPKQEKRDPLRATAEGVESLCQGKERDLAKALVSAYRGLSPQAAREVIFRALERSSATLDEDLPWYSIAARLRELFTALWQPSLVSDDDGQLLAFAPYQLTHLPNAVPQPTMSAALEAFYREREAVTSHSQRREALQQQLDTARERLQRQRDQIQGELDRAQELERLRWEGEMIFAFLHELRPGQRELVIEGRTIELDPQQRPVDAAQERFKAYDKAKSAIEGLPERLRHCDAQLGGLGQLSALVGVADDYDQLAQLEAEAEEQGYLRSVNTSGKRPKFKRLKPLHLRTSEGFDVFVGRSAAQNEEVTFRIGHSDDLWLHVQTIHGAHVIIRREGREVPEQSLREAAGLAAYFSQAREEKAVDVDVSRRSLVRKVPGGPVGLVTYRAEQTLRVVPRAPEELTSAGITRAPH